MAHAFEPKYLKDENRHRTLHLMSVKVSEELNSLYPYAIHDVVRVRLKNGQLSERRVDYPVGHVKNPHTDAQIKGKFFRLAKKVVDEKRSGEIINEVFNLEKVE